MKMGAAKKVLNANLITRKYATNSGNSGILNTMRKAAKTRVVCFCRESQRNKIILSNMKSKSSL